MAGHPFLFPLQNKFQAAANPEQAAPMKVYMKNRFDYLGIKSPERKALSREFLKEVGYPAYKDLEFIIHDLWSRPEREYQYFGEELVRHYLKKKMAGPEILELLETMITHKPWWDTIDMIAQHSVAGLFQQFPELIPPTVDKWMNSGNFWLQRVCILFQNRYKSDTDADLLFRLCDELAEEKEFFIRKAIGWALREYSKTHPEAVAAFVLKHAARLSPLSKKEAIRKIPPELLPK